MHKYFHKALIAVVLVFSMVLPVLTPVVHAAGEASAAGLKDYHSMSMEEIFALDEDLTWVVTGDSITHNTSFTQGMNSYTEWFEKYLQTTGRAGDTLINTAWGGAVVQDFLYVEDTPSVWNGALGDPGKGLEQFITRHNPDIVTIKLGMNNRSTSDANFLKYYNKMLDSIYAEGKKNGKIPKIIVITPTPLSGEGKLNQDETDLDSVWRFQRMLKQLAEERDLVFVDFQTAFTDKVEQWGPDEFRATFFSDSASDGGIHPNAAGQYYMFQTFSKALGIYDENLPIFNIDYKDIVYASLWDEKTTNIDLGYAPDVPLNTEEDKLQMNAAMPSAPKGTHLLTYIDFDAASGYFDGTGSNTVDLTDVNLGDGALSLDEAKGLKKSFSVVFRAKLGYGNEVNSGLFMISSDGLASWNNSLTFGVPSKAHQIWYKLSKAGVDQNDPTHQIPMSGMNIANDGKWHTVAISVSDSCLDYYVDGKPVNSMAMSATMDIGELFHNASSFAARFGKYSDGNVKTYSSLKGNFDFWQFYSDALTAEQVKALSGEASSNEEAPSWLQAYAENNLWAVAGADQMFGYQGMYVNRSLFHLMECAIRATGNQPQHYRDIRLMTAGGAGYTIDDMAERLSKKDFQVLLLLPEVSHVYAGNYVHSDAQLKAYEDSVKALLAQHKDKVRILWTPLASANSTINGYLDDYAAVIRQIAAEDGSILFWDANAFMNKNMQSNASLLDNWFDADMYITPLAATDLGRGFFTTIQSGGVALMTLNELANHNLRENSDNRYLKSEILRDHIAPAVTVSGTTISMDLSAIAAAGYDLSDVQFKVVPSVGYGTANEGAYVIPNVSRTGNVYSFEAPCSNPVIAIYADSHRFRDIAVNVTTKATIPGAAVVAPTDLTDLEVLGAKDFGFDAKKDSYTVNLHQYQSHVQIIGTAAEGQVITVNGEEVLSGQRTAMIEVSNGTTVTVKANGKTYTLKLIRPEYPDIIITEVLEDSSGQKFDMLEIYNASGRDLNLKDYSIGIKKDYTYTMPDKSKDQWPYYFLGNNTGFNSTGSGAVSQTGINPITQYSTYEPGYEAAKEPENILFPAGSTMVVWVRYSTSGTATYQDLINHLTDLADESNYDNKTMNLNGTPVVPDLDQLVVAEIPKGVSASGLSKDSHLQYGYLENHNSIDDGDNINGRTWLFILDKDSQRHYYTGITAAGNDIYSAAVFSRLSTSLNLSTILGYDVLRGMSVVPEAGKLLPAAVTGYTSDKSGYMNLSTFGAIEYWQKPLDLDDDVAPVVVDASEDGKIKLTFRDDTDIRYMELTVDTDGDGIFETVIKQDWVLESSAKSATGTPDAAKERTYTLDVEKGSQYRGFVLDDNNNAASFGCAGDLQITLEGEDTEATVDVQIKLKDCQLLAGLKSDLNIFDAEGKVVGTLSARTLKGTASVKPGQTIKVVGVPEGVEYTVTVIVPDGYEQTAPVTGAVSKGTAAIKLILVAVPETTVAPTTEPETTVEPTTEPETTVESTTGPEATTEPETTVEPTTEPAATEATEGTTPEATEPAVTEPEATQPMDTTAPEATVAPTEPETTAPQQTTEPAQGGNSDSENPKTGNELRQQVIVMLIVVVSAAAAAVTVVIGCKYRKLTR